MLAMIQSAATPICGNAIVLQVEPAAGIKYSKILRRTVLPFTGPNDTDAAIVFVGEDTQVPDLSVDNATQYFYKDYGFNGATFLDDGAPALAATCTPNYFGFGPDVRKVLKQRLQVGFQAEMARGLLKIKGPSITPDVYLDKIPVLLGPPDAKNTKWPVVSLPVETDTQDDRAVGETLVADPDLLDETMLKRYTEEIVIYSQNSDERAELHRALDRVLSANLPVFDSLGMVLNEWRIGDVNILDRQTFETDVYLVSCTFMCRAPAGVVADPQYPRVTAVDVTVNPFFVINGVELDDNAGVL